MSQFGTRPDWIQHDPDHVQRVAEYLPHLWREMGTATPESATTASPTDDAHMPAPTEIGEISPHERLAAAEERFAAELAVVRTESEQWRMHALTIEAEARAQGFAIGHAEGERQGRSDGAAAVRAEAQQSLARLAALADESVVALRAALMASHETLATLGLTIARAIVGETFDHDPGLLARRIVKILERLSDVTTATVHLHPTDLAMVQAHWPGLAQTYGWAEQGPRLLGDDAMTPGGCVIEARTHYLDARIETLSTLVQEAFASVAPLMASQSDSDHGTIMSVLPTPLAEEAA